MEDYILLNCLFNPNKFPRNESPDSSYKYYDVRMNEINIGNNKSLIIILSKVQDYVRSNRIKEIENY